MKTRAPSAWSWPQGRFDRSIVETQSMANNDGSLSGLTANEAKEFHSLFVKSFIGFTAIAIVAHFLVWQWRPWF
jgi:light-harvesting complex 1 beta chain